MTLLGKLAAILAVLVPKLTENRLTFGKGLQSLRILEIVLRDHPERLAGLVTYIREMVAATQGN